MFYMVSLEVLGLRIHLKKDEEIEYLFNAPRSVAIRVSKKYPNGNEPSEDSSAIVIGTTQVQAEDNHAASILETALSTALDGAWANFKGIASDQMSDIYEMIDPVFGSMQKAMRATVSILRWREGLMEGPVSPFRSMREYCSLDGEKWIQIHAARSATLKYTIAPRELIASNDLNKEIVDLVENGIEEPLGHQLFREAWNLRESNPRSALAIGVAAAEVGLKKLIGNLLPDAQWLLDEIPSPPIGMISRKFLPTLHVRARFQGKSVRPPNKLLNKIDEAIKCRNGLVHAGKSPPKSDELEPMLRAIYDFLCVCDVYTGSGWAHKYISPETQNAWEDEAPSGS
jgi:hypothetical protein